MLFLIFCEYGTGKTTKREKKNIDYDFFPAESVFQNDAQYDIDEKQDQISQQSGI